MRKKRTSACCVHTALLESNANDARESLNTTLNWMKIGVRECKIKRKGKLMRKNECRWDRESTWSPISLISSADDFTFSARANLEWTRKRRNEQIEREQLKTKIASKCATRRHTGPFYPSHTSCCLSRTSSPCRQSTMDAKKKEMSNGKGRGKGVRRCVQGWRWGMTVGWSPPSRCSDGPPTNRCWGSNQKRRQPSQRIMAQVMSSPGFRYERDDISRIRRHFFRGFRCRHP